MKLATLNTEGLPTGFYDTEVHGSNIPSAAVPLSDEQWRECVDNAGNRKIVVNSEGSAVVELYVPPAPPAEIRRSRSKQEVDRSAGEARMRFVSPGYLVEQEYREAETAARSWQDAGEPAGSVPSEVQVWSDATGMTPSAAAADIVQTGQAWRDVLAQVRAVRLQGKAAIDAAADADIETTAQTYIDQLDAMTPA